MRSKPWIVLSLLAALLGVSGQAMADPQGTWQQGTAMPTARSELAAAVLDEKIYVAGGMGHFGGITAFEAYDPSSDQWAELAPLPERRHHLALAGLDGRIYAIGGYAGRFLSDTSD